MPLLTVAELKEHVSTGLSDSALRRYLDAGEAEIVRFSGAIATATEYHVGGGSTVPLDRAASSITSVDELASDGTVSTSLAADDYRLAADGYVVERLQTGTNPRATWYGRVKVTYTPTDDTDARIIDLVDLVKLQLAYEGVASHSEDAFSAEQGDYEAQRLAILTRRREPTMYVVGG